MKNMGTVALVGGLGCVTLAFTIQGLLPLMAMEGQNKNVVTIDGTVVELKPYTAEEARGRKVYLREGCWYCHSQYTRPVMGEDVRYGPVSQSGEYAYDQPHLLGTRRIGPDLHREGGKRTNDWQLAHFFQPRNVVPQSIMPAFTWLFDGTESTWVATADEKGDMKAGRGVHPKPSAETEDLLKYVQRLGTDIGDWRQEQPVQMVGRPGGFTMTDPAVDMARGKAVFEAKCAGCHGLKGDGNGEAAAFLDPKPRNFKKGVFKFRSTPAGVLPTDEDLYRTITRGMSNGASMPSWASLSVADRWKVVDYIKTFSDRFSNEKDLKKIKPIPLPPTIERTPSTIARGKMIYYVQQCWQCHGVQGKGDGPATDAQGYHSSKDDWGFPIKVANFTNRHNYKAGYDDQIIYRTFSTGIYGTPMPQYGNDQVGHDAIENFANNMILMKEMYPDLSAFEGAEKDGKKLFTAAELAQLKAFTEGLPSKDQLLKTSEADLREYLILNRYALVHYVQSLSGIGTDKPKSSGGAKASLDNDPFTRKFAGK